MNEHKLLKFVLDVYENDCQYLKEIKLDDKDTKRAWGKFSVPNTCYAVKGRKYHLNAAEVIIIYEQIMYVTLANLFVNGLDELKKIPIDTFFPTVVDEKVLIVKFNARFSQPVANENFTGVFTIEKIVSRKSSYFFYTKFDINDGTQVAEVVLCVDLDFLSA
ncbi:MULTISPECIES: FcoT family thioesterase [Spirulina sp. CCY15215]|uniref:FcoT family thioesterase n=1 Tax=Spirulina sp. CCY15215 TaxID=2767591 RepID=UPI001951A720|nr:FcoT family thioesterase [Spirulina major]